MMGGQRVFREIGSDRGTALAVSSASRTIQQMFKARDPSSASRWLPLPLLLLLLAQLSPMAGATPAVSAASVCQSAAPNDEEATAVCALPVSLAGKNVRFKARFLGSHDDSKVSIRSVTLNGMPVTCRTGSKTESSFEDGVVTLDCGFGVPAAPAGDPIKVQMSLHHLQLDLTELVVE